MTSPVELVESPSGETFSHQSDDEEESLEVRDKVLANILYTVEETPPWYLCILLGLQQSMTCFGGNLSVALIVAPAMCVTDNVVVSHILGTIFFMSGLVTLLQSTLGTRLPLVQGATFSFIVPTFAILSLPQWRCPASQDDTKAHNETGWSEGLLSTDVPELTTQTNNNEDDIWKSRMLEIQGAIMLASLFEVVLGFSGLIGLLVRFIGPLVIAPTITLVGLALFPAAANFASKNWYIAILTSILVIVFSQYLRNINIPCCGRDETGKRMALPVFILFPVILSILLVWGLCAILTASGALPNDPDHWTRPIRTDIKTDVLSEAPWFRFPYPFQWGIPTFSVGAVFGMLAGVIAGAIESVGDYYSCARLAGAPPPPVHAVNRGIFIEGIGCVLAGMWGSGSGSTTYSENIGAIGITKVGSRRVVQVEACFMMLFGVLGKFGALFITIPDPIIGGVFLVLFGMIVSVGVSNLQFVDLNSSRNLCVFGFSVFFGLAFPTWIGSHGDTIKTGSEIFDQIASVLLSTSMFVGGVIGFFLDNTIPGTEEERGLKEWRKHMTTDDTSIADQQSKNSSSESGNSLPNKDEIPISDDQISNHNEDIPTINVIAPNMTDEVKLQTDPNTISLEMMSAQSGSTESIVKISNVRRRSEIRSFKAEKIAIRKANAANCYDFPLVMKYLRNWSIFRYVPVCPTFLQKPPQRQSGNSELNVNEAFTYSPDESSSSVI